MNTRIAIGGALLSGLISSVALGQTGAGLEPRHVGPSLRTYERDYFGLTVASASTTGGIIGRRGTVVLGGASNNDGSLSFAFTSTTLAAMPYPGPLFINVQDGNSDDSLTFTNVTVVVVCEDIQGDIKRQSNTITLDETNIRAITASIACARVDSVTLSRPTSSGDILLDSSDNIRVSVADRIYLPAPSRDPNSTSTTLAGDVEAICIKPVNTTAAILACAKPANCSFTSLRGAPMTRDVNVSTCFGENGTESDQVNLATAILENSSVRIRFRASSF